MKNINDVAGTNTITFIPDLPPGKHKSDLKTINVNETKNKPWPSEGQTGYVFWEKTKTFTEEVIVNVTPPLDGNTVFITTKPRHKTSMPGIYRAFKTIFPDKLASLNFLLNRHKKILKFAQEEIIGLEAKVQKEEKECVFFWGLNNE